MKIEYKKNDQNNFNNFHNNFNNFHNKYDNLSRFDNNYK